MKLSVEELASLTRQADQTESEHPRFRSGVDGCRERPLSYAALLVSRRRKLDRSDG